MLDRDPPDHTRLRRLVSKAFTPRAIQALGPRITGLVDGMLDAAERQGRVDLVDALAFPLPFAVIAEMLGTPPADHERIRQLSGTVVRSLEPVNDPAVVTAIAAADAELTQIAAGMIAWKRAHPADDLLTALINAEDDGDVLDDDELIAQTLLLYIAGHQTTVNLIGGGTLALLRHPDQLALLREDPGADRQRGGGNAPLRQPGAGDQAGHPGAGQPLRRESPPGPSSWPAGLGQPGRELLGVGRRRTQGRPGEARQQSPSAPGRTTAWARRWPGLRPHRPRAADRPVPPGSPRRRRHLERPDQPARTRPASGVAALIPPPSHQGQASSLPSASALAP